MGDYLWVTDKSEPDPNDVDVVYAQVRELGDVFARVRLVRDITDVVAPQEPSS